MTLIDVIRHAALETPDRRIVFAQRDGSEISYGYAELYLRARRALSALQARGFEPGQRVVVQCHSAQRQLELFWACVLGGMVLAVLHYQGKWCQ